MFSSERFRISVSGPSAPFPTTSNTEWPPTACVSRMADCRDANAFARTAASAFVCRISQCVEFTVPSTGNPLSAMALIVSATFIPGASISTPSNPAAFTALNFSVSVPGTCTIPIFSVFHKRPLRPSPSEVKAATGPARIDSAPVSIAPAAADMAVA